MTERTVGTIERIVAAADATVGMLKEGTDATREEVIVVRDELRAQAERMRNVESRIEAERAHLQAMAGAYALTADVLDALLAGTDVARRERSNAAHRVRVLRRYQAGRLRRMQANGSLAAPVVDDTKGE
jgi:hypothetical protein